jgi:hypothetical protein
MPTTATSAMIPTHRQGIPRFWEHQSEVAVPVAGLMQFPFASVVDPAGQKSENAAASGDVVGTVVPVGLPVIVPVVAL